MDADRFEDRFGRQVSYVRVSVTDRCNFRCVYCMPEEGIEHVPRPDLLSFDELRDIVGVFAAHGVTRIRLTGGEPLVRAQMPRLVSMLASLAGIEEVVMTTNAFLLERHATALRDAGLTGLTVSLDSLDPETFARLSRIGDLDRVVRGIRAAREVGISSLKLNAVVIRGENDHEIADLVRFAAAEGAVMRFIEFMPIGAGTGWGREATVTAKEMRQRLGAVYDLQPDNTRYGSGPARYSRAVGPGLPPGGVPVGIISAVTECFCADCNRVRITPQGGLRACLADDRETNLRDALRLAPTREQGLLDVAAEIRSALMAKKESHSFDFDAGPATTKAMTAIGG